MLKKQIEVKSIILKCRIDLNYKNLHIGLEDRIKFICVRSHVYKRSVIRIDPFVNASFSKRTAVLEVTVVVVMFL